MKKLIILLLLLSPLAPMAQTTKKPVSKPTTTKPAAKPASTAPATNTKASYPGGAEAMQDYFDSKLTELSQSYLLKFRRDTSKLQLNISANGTVTSVKVLKSLPDCINCDSVLIKAALAMPKWKAASKAGTQVSSVETIKVVVFGELLVETLREQRGYYSDESFAVESVPVPKEVELPREDAPLDFPAEPAEFPGGNAALYKYLQDSLKMPPSAQENGVSGRVYLKFVVGTDGSISNVEVQRGIAECPECAKEAIRVVRSMPKWKPARNKGQDVKSYFNLPVKFATQSKN